MDEPVGKDRDPVTTVHRGLHLVQSGHGCGYDVSYGPRAVPVIVSPTDLRPLTVRMTLAVDRAVCHTVTMCGHTDCHHSTARTYVTLMASA